MLTVPDPGSWQACRFPPVTLGRKIRMATEPTPRSSRSRKRPPQPKAGFPVPETPPAPYNADAFGRINRGDRGDSDQVSWRSHRDR